MKDSLIILSKSPDKAHVSFNNKYYIISYINNHMAHESLIFESNSQGTISNYSDIGGARETSINEILSNFKSFLYSPINS